ncbi:MAG TPA: hypothetical protein VF547_01465 [Allosphingosinicella sp.]|jgi:hypothetical protein
MTHNRILKLGAAAAVLVAGAAGAAFAHPHPDGDDDRVERVVVVRDGKGGEHHGKAGKDVRRFEIIGADGGHHGKPGKHVRRFEIIDAHGGAHGKPGGPHVRHFEMLGDTLARCESGEKVVDETAGDGDSKTKTVICLKGQPTAATAERLEEALARINSNDELSAEQKARITTALRSAIDRARSAR